MSEIAEWLGVVALGGVLVGQLMTRWAINGYYAAKCPDAVGHRTGIFIKGRMYYLVTEREYVNKVMGPLPDGSRVEIGDNYTRYSHGMPPREGL